MQTKGLTITKGPALAELTSIKLGGRAIAEVRLESLYGLESLPEVLRSLGGRPVVLGRGSNILAKDGELPLVLIRLGEGLGGELKLLREGGEESCFSVSGGVALPVLLSRMAKAGYGGLGGLAGIPGSVGGAVAMNAGSFGSEIKQCLTGVTYFSLAGGLETREAGELELGYRHFGVPGLGKDWFLILEAEFVCPKESPAKIRQEMREFMERKRGSQPLDAASAGCVFKNPDLAPAGKLLQDAGMKGKRRGGMAFSEVHANFLVNEGDGVSDEAFGLIEEARMAVLRSFGVELELEVRVWP